MRALDRSQRVRARIAAITRRQREQRIQLPSTQQQYDFFVGTHYVPPKITRKVSMHVQGEDVEAIGTLMLLEMLFILVMVQLRRQYTFNVHLNGCTLDRWNVIDASILYRVLTKVSEN